MNVIIYIRSCLASKEDVENLSCGVCLPLFSIVTAVAYPPADCATGAFNDMSLFTNVYWSIILHYNSREFSLTYCIKLAHSTRGCLRSCIESTIDTWYLCIHENESFNAMCFLLGWTSTPSPLNVHSNCRLTAIIY